MLCAVANGTKNVGGAKAESAKNEMYIYLLGEVPPTQVAIDLFGD